MRISPTVRSFLAMLVAVLLAGCMSFGQRANVATPFLTLPAPTDAASELVLLAAIRGKVIDDNGCFVLEANGNKSAVIFGHGFSLDRKSGILRDGEKGGRTLRIGRNGQFSGGKGTRVEAERKLGLSLPETCPANVVQIDEIKR